jgi:fused signal recognition particle receptor
MSESGKRKLFGRLFGGGKPSAPEPALVIEEKPAGEPLAGEAAPPEQAAVLEQGAPPEQVQAVLAPAEPIAAAEPVAAEGEKEGKRLGWFQRLKQGLTRTSSRLTEGITSVFTKRKLDDETLEELEDLLIQADLGLDVAASVTAALKESRYNSDIAPEEVRAILAQEVERVLAPVARPLEIDPAKKPHVVLMVGVNGTGKTTTIGKYASQFTKQGFKVMLAAGDTFRAAAIEQLKIWGERTGAPVVAGEPGADAAGLAFDALRRAQDENYDILLVDTAGRLQNKTALMAELEKVIRVIKKIDSTAPHSVVLTLDATTGQNALSQVEIFGKIAGVTGLVMTKLDGTARGGILVAIASKFALPVHAIGVGESAADLQAFQAQDFARAIAGVA